VKGLKILWRGFDALVSTVGVFVKTLVFLITAFVNLGAVAIPIVAVGLVNAFAGAGAAGLAAGLKAAASWALAALPIVLIVGLLALLILVIDDIQGALEGQDSLIGELAEKFGSFIEEWMKPRADDGFLVRTLKVFWDIFSDLPKALDNAANFWVEKIVWVVNEIKKLFAGLWEDVKQGAADALDALNPFSGRKGGLVTTAANAFRATQAQQDQTRIIAQGRQAVEANLRIDNITVNAPTGDAKDIVNVLKTEMDKWHSARMREALVGTK
jgi:hypothetical protein